MIISLVLTTISLVLTIISLAAIDHCMMHNLLVINNGLKGNQMMGLSGGQVDQGKVDAVVGSFLSWDGSGGETILG